MGRENLCGNKSFLVNLRHEATSKATKTMISIDESESLVQHEKAATFLDILKSFFRPTLVRV